MHGLPSSMPSTALFTDHYELTMLQAALRSGIAERRVVFEVFARRLPRGRRYGLVVGTERALEAIQRFRFDQETLSWLQRAGVVDERTCEYLASYRFSGDVDGYPEGEAYFEGSPVLVVEGSFAEAVLLETLVLSTLNHDSAVGAAAARIVCAAGDRPCIEMGGRRTHELAAVAAARAAYVAGFVSTSNLAAGQRWGIPTTGTSAHAFTLVHQSESEAFAAQVRALGTDTTLLVDTYDVEQGIRTAIDVAGPGLGAIRLDSGDLIEQALAARKLLDELGATKTRIIVTSDLDEHAIAALAAAPVDGYGVGTSVVMGGGSPTAGLVYKLVARERDGHLEAVAKKSAGKAGRGGRKVAARRIESGVAVAEVVYVDQPLAERADERPLSVPLMRGGSVVHHEDAQDARSRWRAVRAELPAQAMQLSAGEASIPTVLAQG